jgi:RHS repeat-associated protein
VGWALSGLSEIERCKKSIAQDGANGGVTLAVGDAYCLEGNRLRLTSAPNTYGLAGSTYQTEMEQFSRVTANGSTGNGPASFTVEGKDGLKYEYGNTADSFIQSNATGFTTTARVWALNKVSDRYGNTMTVTYQEDGANGSFRPTQIDYTSNANTGLAASYRVVFVWETRPADDTLTQYYVGGLIRENQRLKQTVTKYNDPVVGWRSVRTYQLSYSNNVPSTLANASKRSRLVAIQECDTAGSCLAPTSLSWGNGLPTFGADNSNASFGYGATYAIPIDVNGDGRMDAVYPVFDASSYGTWYFALAQASGGYGSPTSTGITGTNFASQYLSALPIDFNGDGLGDILIPSSGGSSGGTWQVLQSTGTNFTLVSTPYGAPAAANRAWVTDIDGDGRSDVVYLDGAATQNTVLTMLRNTGGAFTSLGTVAPLGVNAYFNTIASSSYKIAAQSAVSTVDVNGDSRGDLLISYSKLTGNAQQGFSTENYLAILVSSGSSYALSGSPLVTFVQNTGGLNALFDTLRVADFNGDGHLDITYNCNGNWCVRYGVGTGLSAEVTGLQQGTDPSKAIIADWNGDGLADIMEPAVSGNWRVLLGNSDVATPLTLAGDSNAAYSSVQSSRVGDVNGDGLPDLEYLDSSNVWHYRLHNAVVGDLTTSVSDGFGNYVTVDYAPLTDSSVYTKGTGATYPEVDVQAPMLAVKSYVANDGAGSTYTVSESYSGLQANLQGRGLEGFASRAETDSRTGITTTSVFNQLYPKTGTVDNVSVKQSNGKTISTGVSVYTDMITGGTGLEQRHFVFANSVTQTSFELDPSNAGVDGLSMSSEVTTTSMDPYGTPITVQVVSNDLTGYKPGAARTVYTINTINNDTTNWCLGFVTTQAVTNTVPGLAAQTRTVQTDKDTTALDKCRALQQIVEPSDPSPFKYKVTTGYGYDSFGHVNSQTVSAAGIANRLTTTNYGTQGVFPLSVTNAESETASKTYDYALGVVKTATDANGLTVIAAYDNFGRKTLETRPDSTKTSWTLYGCTVFSAYCGSPLLRFQVIEQQLDANNAVIRQSTQFLDGQERTRFAQTQSLSGATAVVATEYDALGRVYKRSQPYFAGAVAVNTTYTYDLLGRTKTEQRPVSDTDTSTQTLSYSYARLVNTFVDSMGKSTIKQHNAIGQVERVTDPNSALTNYSFDPFGNLLTTKDPANNTITNTFSIRGFKLTTGDPDMGNWVYAYYPTGELNTQTDAKGQLVTFSYDRVGRQKTRVEPEGTTTWTYGTSQALKNVGQLSSVTSPGSYSESYTYDALGRSSQVATLASGTTYNVDSAYDGATGLLDSVTYPTSTTAVPGSRFKVQYTYNYGQLKSVRDFNTPSLVYWQSVATNAAGQATDELAGNGFHTLSNYDSITGRLNARTTGASSQIQNLSYLWDKAGNLTQRRDVASNLTEGFIYDNLYRVTSSTLNSVNNLTVSYAANGNILTKTGLTGTYNYTTAQTGCTYTGQALQPHAVRNAGGVVYCYDKNGNMTLRGGQATTWASYNLPTQINKTATTYTQFSYGASRARYRQVSVTAAGQNMPAGTETTIYIGSLFEKVTKPSAVTEYKHTILAGGEAIAIKTLRSNSINDVRYLHKDHLGSVDAVTSDTATLVSRFSFDAFGKRRAAGTWSGSPTAGEWSTAAGVTHRGFTYHEQLDNVDLVHMNGRVYDPNIGRFLSADPIVQAPLMSQSINRYTYVMNNPLSLVDPSGFSWLSKLFRSIGRFIQQYWRPILAIVLAVVTYGAVVGHFAGIAGSNAASAAMAAGANGAGTLTAFNTAYAAAATSISTMAAAGAAAGFVSGAVMGGIRGAVTGAISGALFGAVGGYYKGALTTGRVLASGAVGGVTSEISGGDFWDGFKLGAALSMVQWAGDRMRQSMIKQSKGLNAMGQSDGVNGDRFKLGGARTKDGWSMDRYLREAGDTPFGGAQGGPGYLKFFGYYQPGSWQDNLVESFAGPHDWLSQLGYNGAGNGAAWTGTFVGGAVFTAISAAALLPATGIVGAAYGPALAYSDLWKEQR